MAASMSCDCNTSWLIVLRWGSFCKRDHEKSVRKSKDAVNTNSHLHAVQLRLLVLQELHQQRAAFLQRCRHARTLLRTHRALL